MANTNSDYEFYDFPVIVGHSCESNAVGKINGPHGPRHG